MMKPRPLGRIACLVGMAAVAGLTFHRVFGSGPITLRVLGAALGAAAIPIALQRWRPVSAATSVSVSVVAAVVYIAVTTLSSPTDVGELVDGVIHGWSELLTSSLPAPAEPVLLVLPVVLTWLATMVSVELAMRTRLVVLTLAPSAIAYAVALLFSATTDGDRILPALVFVALGIGALRLATDPVGQAEVIEAEGVGIRQRTEQLAAGIHISTVLSTTAVVVVAVLIASLLPGDQDPYDPRADRTPPVAQLQEVNPLSLLSDWAQHPHRELFTVQASRPAAWRLAVLDRYDGVQWSTGGEFVAGGATPQSAVSGGETLEQSYQLSNLPGVLLPSAAVAASATGPGVIIDAATGTLARLGSGDGFRYTVQSELPTITSCELVVGLPPAPAPQQAPADATEAERRTYERLASIVAGSVT